MKKIYIILTIFIMNILLTIGIIYGEEEKIPVLMYHHFDSDKSKIFSTVVYTEEFIKQMDYLNDNGYNTITCNELEAYINDKKDLPEKSVLITTDDGYLSNYEFMYKILKERNMKATMFIIGERVDHAYEQREGILKVNWAQIEEMYHSGLIDFQSHTYDSHSKINSSKGSCGSFSVADINESEEKYKTRIDNDIKTSLKNIEQNLGYKPIAIAYPFGEYSNISEEVIKANDVKLSFTVKEGFVDSTDNGYLLNRINISGYDSIDSFISKLSK